MSRLYNDEQRARIRSRCFEFLDEVDETVRSIRSSLPSTLLTSLQISETNGVIFAKLARSDFPQAWFVHLIETLPALIINRPSLTQVLCQLLETHLQAQLSSSSDTPNIVLRRVIRVMHLITKELSQMKIPSGIRAMQQVSLLVKNISSSPSRSISLLIPGINCSHNAIWPSGINSARGSQPCRLSMTQPHRICQACI